MGQHYEYTITLLMILPSMPHHHTPYEPPPFRNLLQYMTKPPPLVHPLRLSLIYIFMCPMLPECYMFFPDLWGRRKISMMEYVPLKYFCLQTYHILLIGPLASDLFNFLPVLGVPTRITLLVHFHIIFPPQVCGLVVLLQRVKLSHHPFWPFIHYKLVL